LIKAKNPKMRKITLLSIEINFTNSSGITPTISRTIIKLVDNNNQITELVMRLNVNHEENVLRGLAEDHRKNTVNGLKAC
jgi:hypothetical protein